MTNMTDYNPEISALLDQCENDWGDPAENRENLVPYGIQALDLALYGINCVDGELAVILGPHKQRKTTFALNILCNIHSSPVGLTRPPTVVDTLESGMPPKRYRDSIISIMATRYLLEQGHAPSSFCQACGTPKCRQMGISPEFLRYNSKSPEQVEAIEYAIDTMRTWDLRIFGANPIEGNTRSLSNTVSRWETLIQEEGATLFIIDHVQQYQFEHDNLTDYEKQQRSVSAHSDIVAKWNVATLMLSQISLQSWREARTFEGKMNAAGGTKAQAESNVTFSVGYQPGSGEMKVSIEESRKSSTFTLFHPLEDVSGSFYGTPKTS